MKTLMIIFPIIALILFAVAFVTKEYSLSIFGWGFLLTSWVLMYLNRK